MSRLVGLVLWVMPVGAILSFDARGSDERLPAGQALAAEEVIAVIDAALEQHWEEVGLSPSEPVADGAFFRRLSLDLHDKVPARAELQSFLADPDPGKRTRVVRRLIEDRASAKRLAGEWSSLLIEKAPPSPSRVYLHPWLEQSFADNTPLSEMVTALIAGRGRTDENGAVSFVLSYGQDYDALAAVTARAFLGLQLQCAQCHDHPSDRWLQQEFRALTGFFRSTRGAIVEVPEDQRAPVYALSDLDPEQRLREALAKRLQRGEPSKDGMMTPAPMAAMTPPDENFVLDPSGPGKATDAARALAAARLADPVGPTPEQIDQLLTDPASRSKVERARAALAEQQPRHLDGAAYEDIPDRTPREALAGWMVDPDNPYFARAAVNRTWHSLFGYGLVEAVDDLSGSTDVVLPELLEFLAEQFLLHETDLRFLTEVLVRSRAYSLGPGAGSPEERLLGDRHFASHALRPFTSAQVLSALTAATGQTRPQGKRGARTLQDREKAKRFNNVFGDERGHANHWEVSIPQMLYLMNGVVTNEDIENGAHEILADADGDARRALDLMYLGALSRLPEDRERSVLLPRMQPDPQGAVDARGLVDVYWSILNSTEFLTHH